MRIEKLSDCSIRFFEEEKQVGHATFRHEREGVAFVEYFNVYDMDRGVRENALKELESYVAREISGVTALRVCCCESECDFWENGGYKKVGRFYEKRI